MKHHRLVYVVIMTLSTACAHGRAGHHAEEPGCERGAQQDCDKKGCDKSAKQDCDKKDCDKKGCDRGARASGHHGEKPGMHHSFAGAEQWAERWDSAERDAWQKPEAVIAAMKLAPDARIADIGAGTGYFTMRFARAVPAGKVYAIDIEPDMVRYLGERAQREGLANVEVVAAEPNDPKLSQAVDVIFLCNTYHHIDQRKAYFGELRGRLAPGGRLVIVDFKLDSPHGPPVEHRMSMDEVQRELTEAGYRLVSGDEETLPNQYLAVFEPTAEAK